MPKTTITTRASDAVRCQGDEFTVEVTIDANEGAINAIQGTLVYDASHISAVSIQHGKSVLRYWVTKPALPDTPGSIEFIGGLPYPGFTGTGGNIMSVVFRADAPGTETSFTVAQGAKVLLNDGNGTETSISYVGADLSIAAADTPVCLAGPAERVIISDSIPPEPFEVIITRDEQIFDGAYFAAYDTVDNETGVSFYQVRETSQFISTPWQRRDSPYQLRTQGGDVLIQVEAVDGAGNSRLASASVTIDTQSPRLNLSDGLLLGAVIISAILIVGYCRKRLRGE